MSVATDHSLNKKRLLVTDRHGVQREFALAEGATLMIGSGANCGVRLLDPQISSIHCLLRLQAGELQLQDWCTALGTYVDDRRIEEEVTVGEQAEIRIGNYKLRIVLQATPATTKPVPAVSRTADNDGPPRPPKVATETVEPPLRHVEPPLHRGAPAAPVARLMPEVRPLERPMAGRVAEIVDPETVALLRAEIDCLQSELAERDRQLSEYAELIADPSLTCVSSTDAADVERLVTRLEDLLDELKRHDQRIKALEDLLRAEQDLAHHQEEERRQIEAWLGEIEQRVSAREAEWTAERAVLASRVEQLKQARDEADRQIQAAHLQATGSSVQDNLVTALRAEVDRLQELYGEAQRRVEQTTTELEVARHQHPDQVAQEQIDAAIRAERLALAQERAALSRERAELARGQADHNASGAPRPTNPADERFQAFRQTLRELHQAETTQEAAVRRPSLGSRLADLWRRLDGPTDSD